MSSTAQDRESDEEMPWNWEMKRIKCLFVYLMQFFVLSVDHSLIVSKQTLHLGRTRLPVDKNVLDILVTLSYVSSVALFSLILGRYADKYRKTKRLILIGNVCSILGNVIYAVPYSIVSLLFGQFIRGIGRAVYVIVIGEVARSYLPKDLLGVISLCLTVASIGSLLSPIVEKCAHHWHDLWDESASILFVAGLYLIAVLLTAILASDLSLEYDVKANLGLAVVEKEMETRYSEDTDDFEENAALFGPSTGNTEANANWFTILLKLLRNPITLAVIWSSFVLTHSKRMLVDHVPNLSAVGIPDHYTSVVNSLTVFTTGMTYLVVGSISKKVADISIVCAGYFLVVLSSACWLIIAYLPGDDSALLPLFIIYLAASSISSCGEIALLVLMAKLVPCSVQSFSEAFRVCLLILGSRLADALYSMESQIPLVSTAISLALCFITIPILNMNYQYLVDPKPIVVVQSQQYY